MIPCNARADEVVRTIAAVAEREADGFGTAVEIVEEVSAEEVLVEFREPANDVVDIVPEPSECTEEWYGVRHVRGFLPLPMGGGA